MHSGLYNHICFEETILLLIFSDTTHFVVWLLQQLEFLDVHLIDADCGQ